MARFFPAKLGTRSTFGERLMFERLHDLDDSWVVLSQLQFLSRGSARSTLKEGESDFVLMHPKHGLLLIEVKDARYRVEGRQWYRLPKGGGAELDTSPFEQARNNRHRIDNILKDAGIAWIPSGYAVLFTAGRPSGRLGPDAPEQIVVSRDQLENVGRLITRLASHWGSAQWRLPSDFEQALKELSPTVLVAPTLQYAVDVSMGELERLTDRQATLSERQLEAVRVTAANPRSLVLGAAGTGKTFVGYTYARKRAAEGARVAVIGVPPQLRLLTRRRLASQGVYAGEAMDVLASAYSEAIAAEYVGTVLWEAIVEIVEEYGPRLDCLVVDEAQSLDSDVLEALSELVAPGGQVVLLADPYQKDSTGTWLPNGNFQTFWLTENCRNTLPIAKVVSRVAGMQTPVDGADGPRPVFTHVTEGLWDASVAAIRRDLVTIPANDAVVLTRTPHGAKRMYEALQRAGFRASRNLKEDRIAALSVDDFRGCEAKYVAYVADSMDSDDLRTVDYVATSRACAHLRVLGDERSWEDSRFLFNGGETT